MFFSFKLFNDFWYFCCLGTETQEAKETEQISIKQITGQIKKIFEARKVTNIKDRRDLHTVQLNYSTEIQNEVEKGERGV